MNRPVPLSDLLDAMTRGVFAMPRTEALRLGLCLRCQRPVSAVDLAPEDRAEYAISALCPECYEAITPDEEPETTWLSGTWPELRDS